MNASTIAGLVALGFPDRLVETTSGCWEWDGARQSGKWNYGRTTHGSRWTSTHRLAWRLANDSEPPAGKRLRHTCDNPPCCNPAHLVLGTAKDNTADMDKRGRRGDGANPGERNGQARLTAEQVAQLRRDRSSGMTYRQLAEKYSIHKSHVHRVVNHINWKAA